MPSLRIAMLAPLKRPLTPDTTVSRLRIIVDLSQELIRRGHSVTIFATEDSHLSGAKIVGVAPSGINNMASENPLYLHLAYDVIEITRCVSLQSDFDIVHNHLYPEFLPLLSEKSLTIPMVTTIHSQMTRETSATLSCFPGAHVVGISESAKKLSGRETMDVVYNGIDTEFFVSSGLLSDGQRGYYLFIGRMSKAKDAHGNFLDPKGATDAIAVAGRLGIRLKLVGNVEDRTFFDQLIKPHLSERIEFVGEVSTEQMQSREELRSLYQGAIALINPIRWEEPFGLVMAEAMACGTPVIAYGRGSVPEVVKDGETGIVVPPEKGIEGLAEAIGKIGEIDRGKCREHAVAKFSIQAMVDGYEALYRRIIEGGR